MQNILKKCLLPPKIRYLFLGSLIGRGKNSLETLILVLSLMLQYPKDVFILRGSQEIQEIARVRGFYDEGIQIMKILGLS